MHPTSTPTTILFSIPQYRLSKTGEILKRAGQPWENLKAHPRCAEPSLPLRNHVQLVLKPYVTHSGSATSLPEVRCMYLAACGTQPHRQTRGFSPRRCVISHSVAGVASPRRGSYHRYWSTSTHPVKQFTGWPYIISSNRYMLPSWKS
jgi:hypothetical protein